MELRAWFVHLLMRGSVMIIASYVVGFIIGVTVGMAINDKGNK